jgi:predicted Zn-dependent peptidase
MRDGYKEYRLDNGLHVALERTPTETISGRLTVNHGTVDEMHGEEGVAHFLEHVLVAGGAEGYSPAEMRKVTASLGKFNAGTSITETILDGGFLSKDLGVFLGAVSATTFNPTLDEEKIEEERRRILREMSGKFSSPGYLEFREFQKNIIGKHPLTKEVLGSTESVRGLKQEDLRRFHERGYTPDNMELVLVGGLPNGAEGLIEKYFGGKKAGNGRGRFKFQIIDSLDKRVISRVPAPDLLVEGNVSESNAKIRLNFLTPPINHEDFEKLFVLSSVLGGGQESLVFQKISAGEGLAYSINSFYDGGSGVGNIITLGYVQANRCDEAVRKIFECCGTLRDMLVDQGQLDRIKGGVEYQLASGIETNEGRGDNIRGYLEHGRTTRSMLDSLEIIQPEDIRETARKYLPVGEDDNYALFIRDPLMS